MPHPEIRNDTPFATELLLLADEEGRPLVVPLVQATFAIGARGDLAPAAGQPPPEIGGACWGDPETSSLRHEPQIAWMKPATDIVLHGHAQPPTSTATTLQVGIRVGPLQKVAAVFGDRLLVGRSRMTPPQPFERIPLLWEHAFGGWDRRRPEPERHRSEARNRVGRGYRDPSSSPDEDLLLPNIEDPNHLFRQYGDTPPPAGFGFVSPDWLPRAAFAGTYDAAWAASRMPQLPADFDRRFFSAAAPGLVAPGYLRGDEAVVVIGTVPEGRLAFSLPGLPPPACRLDLKGRTAIDLQMLLDTLLVDTDARTVTLTYRACVPTRNGVHDVVAATFRAAEV